MVDIEQSNECFQGGSLNFLGEQIPSTHQDFNNLSSFYEMIRASEDMLLSFEPHLDTSSRIFRPVSDSVSLPSTRNSSPSPLTYISTWSCITTELIFQSSDSIN